MMTNTTIILSSFNGEKYIDEQLESIERVVKNKVDILICDDNSCDRTVEIIERYIERSRHNVSLRVNEKNLGPTKVFKSLLNCVETKYVVFCDQDDIWTADRVQLTENSSADFLISQFEIFECQNAHSQKKYNLPQPSLFNGLLMPRFPGCSLSGKAKCIRFLWGDYECDSLYDWFLVSRGILLRASFELTSETCFLYRRHPGTVTKMGHAPDGILKALKRRYVLIKDLVGCVQSEKVRA